MTRVALELVGQGGLGHSFDSLEPDSPTPLYTKAIKEFLYVSPLFYIFILVLIFMRFTSPELFKLTFSRTYILPFAFRYVPPKLSRAFVDLCDIWNLHTVRDMIDVMHDTSVEILNEKKAALAKGGEEAMLELTASGKDIISVLGKRLKLVRERWHWQSGLFLTVHNFSQGEHEE